MTITRRDILLTGGSVAATMAATGVSAPTAAEAQELPRHWNHTADVVVIGSGAVGLPASIACKEGGQSVILVEAENHVGGHAAASGGNVTLGGGTAAQKKAGIVDSTDLYFHDLTDWSVVEPNGFPDYRYNDREVVRAFADESPATYDWLIAHGVVFVDKAPDSFDGVSSGNSAPRSMHAAAMHWTDVWTGKPLDPDIAKVTAIGAGLTGPLEAAARKAGVQFLLEHRMTEIYREPHNRGGRAVGIAVEHDGKKLNIRARKAVIIGTGGSTNNVNFRRMFDPRLTEEYICNAGAPWSEQNASGELAGMAIGASLWGLYNQTGEFGSVLSKPGFVGCQYNYLPMVQLIQSWQPGSAVFHKARATGLRVMNWQDVITVNMLGKRFYDETSGSFTANDYGSVKNYVQGSWRNAKDMPYKPNNWLNAAMAGIGDGHNGGGAIWAIFDADAVAREKWETKPPHVDPAFGFFFSANTIGDLAKSIKMKYQRVPMPPENLEQTVERYNSFVDKGVDDDFDKPKPLYKIAKPPFYAAWATPAVHDTRAGLRINAKSQVMDINGHIIPGLYCGGESAGGFCQHGLARAAVQGLIAAKHIIEKA